MVFEHFGIAHAESLASSLIPVVHKSGGIWSGIVEFGKYDVGYDSLELKLIANAILVVLSRWTPEFFERARRKAI